ncbi:MAG TPA: hypothetical protein PKD90_05670, partial [Phnomibacter sp.]|nr:hypothetical protein [Phnomibacter sp.]
MNTLSLESFYHQAKAVVQQHGFAGIFPYIIVGFSLEAAPNMKPAVIVEIIVSNVRNNFIQVRSSTPDGALAELTKYLS